METNQMVVTQENQLMGQENLVAQNMVMAMGMEENSSFIADLTAKRVTAYSSIKAVSMEEKKAFFNAVNSTEKRIGDCINEVINIKDVYVEVVQCVNRETGEAKD